jgi:regulatory protein
MDQPKPTPKIDEKTALAKAEHYCAYQERSQQEVRDKLYEWGLHSAQVENLIVQLIQTNFLNEAFNQKGWGKQKIKQGLKFKKVSDVLIKKALNTIDDDDYSSTLKQILDKKARLLGEKDPFKKRYKLHQYALSRGFENDIISDILKNSEL